MCVTAKVQLKLDQHNLMNMASRRKFYKHNDRAMDPKTHKYLSIIIDGMTQNTTLLPHLFAKPSWWSAQTALQCQCTGILSWGASGFKADCEFTYRNVSDNSAFLCDNIERAILRNQAECRRMKIPYPSVLYIQLDNVSHNKSFCLVGFLCVLILRGVFDKIKVSFMVKGHTHEIIDQMFSRLSVLLRKRDAITIEEMMKACEEAYKPIPKCEHIQHQHDWDPYVKDPEIMTKFNHIKHNRCFKMELVDGKCMFSARTFMTSGEWSEPIEVVHRLPTEEHPKLRKTIPLTQGKASQMEALHNAKKMLFDHNDQQDSTAQGMSEVQKVFWDEEVKKQVKICKGEDVNLSIPDHVWPEPSRDQGKHAIANCTFACFEFMPI